MKFHCDRCDAQYMISDEKVGANGVKVRCKKCQNVIVVRRVAESGANGAAAPEAPAAAAQAPARTPGEGLDVDLGNAFDHAFGDTPAGGTPAGGAPSPDLDATQAMSPEEAARVAAASAASPAAAAPAAADWYVAIGQAQVGPLPLAEVKRKWESGDVGPDSLVWRPGMGDWAPLTSVADLAAYLAPVPQAPKGGRAAPSPAAPVAPRVEPAAPAADVSWKPAGASALAALASEEIASRGDGPRPSAAAAKRPAGGGVRSLVETMDLPDGGGVDPTGAIPLPMKALERTGESRIEKRSSVARGAEELRHRRSVTRIVVTAAVIVLAVVGAAAWFVHGRMTPAERPAVAAAPAARPAAEPVPPPPAPAPTAAPAPATALAAAPAPEAGTAAPEAAARTEPPAPPPERRSAEPPAPAPRVARAEAPARTRREPLPRKERETRVAQATPPPPPAAAPAPAPTRRKDSLLDFESNDAALDAALGTGGGSGRSVYVPPAAGGGSLPATVSDSQVNESIMGRVSALQQCVQEQKARDAEGTGVLKMRWVIAPDGSAREVKCLTSEYASSPIAQCLTGVLKGTRFPKSANGRSEVTFPIKF